MFDQPPSVYDISLFSKGEAPGRERGLQTKSTHHAIAASPQPPSNSSEDRPDRLLLGLLALIVLLSGCSGSRPSSSQHADSAAPSSGFVRAIAPFPVKDTSGAPYAHPFLGGLNVPRPQFVDIDDDGDADLFVQEHTNQLMFFEHTGAAARAGLTWRTDHFHDLAIGEWFRFADMDDDGDFDLLAEQPYSYIRYYRNDGTAQQPDFTLAADSLKDVNGTPIFSDRQNIPNVTDIDCDGQLDLFIGRLDGTVTRYESTGRNAQQIPQFKLVTERFEDISIVKQLGTMHGANTLTFADIDHDDDQDLFWGDFFEPSLLLIENTGSCRNPVLQGEPQPFPSSNPVKSSGYNAPAFADWGQDGDLDLFVGVLGGAYNANETLAKNFHFYERSAEGAFHLRTKQFLHAIDIGSESMPAVGDLDGDGDQDVLLANKIDPGNGKTSLVYRFENQGSATQPSFRETGTLDLPDAYHYAPALGDLDGDGDPDLLLGTWKGRIAYYRNTGDGFEAESSNFVALDRGSNSAPALADIDDDGDLDLFVGESGGGVHFFRNEGTSKDPAFVLDGEAFSNVEVEHRSVPSFSDVDGDGDLDLVVGTKSNGLAFYRNTGSAQQPRFAAEELPLSIDAPRLATPVFSDLDGDGDADFLSGSIGGGLVYYANQGEER